MSKEMMSSLLESSGRKPSLGRAVTTFCTSFLLQSLVVAVLMLVPLMATDTLPMPEVVASRIILPTIQVKPPNRRVQARPHPASANRTVPVLQGVFVTPVGIPDRILDDVDFFESSTPSPIEFPEDILGKWMREGAASAERPAPPVTPIRVSQLQAPRRIEYVAPIYPEIARMARKEGVVILEAVIDTEGAVVNLRVLRSEPLLDRAAQDAVSQWKYEPTLLSGMPVPIVMTITVRFTLS